MALGEEIRLHLPDSDTVLLNSGRIRVAHWLLIKATELLITNYFSMQIGVRCERINLTAHVDNLGWYRVTLLFVSGQELQHRHSCLPQDINNTSLTKSQICSAIMVCHYLDGP